MRWCTVFWCLERTRCSFAESFFGSHAKKFIVERRIWFGVVVCVPNGMEKRIIFSRELWIWTHFYHVEHGCVRLKVHIMVVMSFELECR